LQIHNNNMSDHRVGSKMDPAVILDALEWLGLHVYGKWSTQVIQ